MKAVALVLAMVIAQVTPAKENWKELVQKGDAAMESEKYSEAIKFYDQALGLQPKKSEILGSRGKCYSSLGRFEDALRDFDKAIERRLVEDGYWETPEICFLYFEKAFAFDQLGRHGEAVPFYEKVVRLDKTYPYGHNNLGHRRCSSNET